MSVIQAEGGAPRPKVHEFVQLATTRLRAAARGGWFGSFSVPADEQTTAARAAIYFSLESAEKGATVAPSMRWLARS